jgi:hypothetical protein
MERSFRASAVLAGYLTAAIVFIGADGRVGADPTEATVTIEGGTVSERARLSLALRRFEEAGLALPELRIVFRDPSHEDCHGALGSFSPSGDVWQISMCSTFEFVYEHELAHAWERANLTDTQRHRYVVFRGLATWSDRAYDRNQRGVEDLALVVQQGLAGLPLPPALGDEARSRLQGYEMMTGHIAPRLVDWLATHDVSCSERPTRFSLQVPDVSGRTCGPPPRRTGAWFRIPGQRHFDPRSVVRKSGRAASSFLVLPNMTYFVQRHRWSTSALPVSQSSR